jgi:NAD(P)H-dependent flavin oxidoreductase YrpB (nitropropane dioxygenase family)
MIRTALEDLVGVEAPVVCTGMGFVSDPSLAAAVCNAGALGIVAAAMMTLPELEAAVAQMNQMTRQPYGVNLRSDAPDLEDRARVLIDGGVKVASFALAPNPVVMGRLKEAGLVCIPSVGARKHAEKVAGWGADAVIAQGSEAGGHTGNVPTSLLVPQIVDSVDIPVIAAGGFFDGRGLIAALAYGAAGIAMGTRFLLTRESPVPMSMKERYLRTQITETVVTSSIDGHPHRVIRTELIADLERHGLVREVAGAMRNARQFQQLSGRRWPSILRQSWTLKRQHDFSLRQLVMAANAPMLCRAAMVDGREDIGVLSSGQVVGMIDDIPSCDELIARIMAEADGVLGALEESAA